MALQFPANPADGDVYPPAPNSEYIYNDAKGAWLSLPNESAKTVTSDNAPANPKDGDQWFNTVDGTLYIYIVDVNGGQWVESQAPITANGYYSPNYIINGAFDIWQRGTSFSNPSSYTADRWIAFTAGTASRSTDVPNASFKYSMALSHTSASYNIIQQRIESSNSIALGKEVTLSFWAKGTSGTNNLQIALYYANTVDVHSAQTFISQSGITTSAPSTSWTRYSRTITLPDAAVTNGWEFRLFRDDSSVNGWLVTGVQLEAGAVATTFRRNANSIQGELAACQRYYWRETISGTYSTIGVGIVGNNTTNAIVGVDFPVAMRVPPTSLEWSNLHLGDLQAYAHAVTSLSVGSTNASITRASVSVACSGGGMTQFRTTLLHCEGGASSYFGLSAEL